MTKIQFITSALGASLLTGAACAGVDGFLGYSGEISSYQDFTVIDMYAEFSSDDYVVLNVFNATITLSDGSGFNHNDLADPQGGSWKPSFSFDIPGAYDSMADSYVTIGYGVGADAALNQTALDPGFGEGNGGLIPEGTAGWFNLTPDNPQFAVDGRVKIGHFVFEMELTGSQVFSFGGEIGFNSGPGTDIGFGNDLFVTPAPGALALIGIGGLAARRRRS